MTVTEKVAALRRLMSQHGWQAVVVSGTDPHASEYLPDRWQQRKWISGFTGSYGTVVVTMQHAGLWTDTRYFIQATQEFEGTEFVLHKLRVPDAVDYPRWLALNLPHHAVVGIDGLCMSVSMVQQLQEALSPLQARIDNCPNFLDQIRVPVPPLPLSPLFTLDPQHTGRSTQDKLTWLRQQLQTLSCQGMLLNSLDQIAWLYNIRCNDVPFNPVAISYAYIDHQAAYLFITWSKVGKTVRERLAAVGVTVRPYESLAEHLLSLPPSQQLLIDGSSLNYEVYRLVTEHFGAAHITDRPSPVLLEKALKNPVEQEGFRLAYIKDGVAMTRFFIWLEKALESGQPVTEVDASAKLTLLRGQGDDAMGDSFHYISAYGPNAALPHYFPNPTNCSQLLKKGLYLIDSGGQYLHGTTDITRTIPLGPLTPLEREDYTLVLKGMIALSTAVFLEGTTGAHLDILPRLPLWKGARNYGHGTGHGIGHYLCVHEGPQDIRLTWRDQPLCPGMVTSNEPGMYRAGLHGVRHENVLLCCQGPENEFGRYLYFETLTLVYIDPAPLLWELLNEEEQAWLKAYNQKVYDTLAPLLSADEARWLAQKIAG